MTTAIESGTPLSRATTERVALVLFAAPLLGALLLMPRAAPMPLPSTTSPLPIEARVMSARTAPEPSPTMAAPTLSIVATEVTGFPLSAVLADAAGAPPAQRTAPPLPADRATSAFLIRSGERVASRTLHDPSPTPSNEPRTVQDPPETASTTPNERVTVADPRTLRVGDRLVRLAGLAEVAAGTPCRALDGRPQDCAERTIAQLAVFIEGKTPTCRSVGDAHLCRVGSTDLADWLVRRGLARPEGADGARYAEAATFARRHRLGLWGITPSSR